MRNPRNALLGLVTLTSVCGLGVQTEGTELYIRGVRGPVATRPLSFVYGASYLDNYYAKRSLVSPYGFSYGSYYPPYHYRNYYRYGSFSYRNNRCCW